MQMLKGKERQLIVCRLCCEMGTDPLSNVSKVMMRVTYFSVIIKCSGKKT